MFVLSTGGIFNLIDALAFILEYIWAPVLVTVIIWFAKKIAENYLRVKEIKKRNDPDIAGFRELYDNRIKESMRIEVEEILKFIGREEQTDVEHHLYICKREGKVVGFIKFMTSKTKNCLFIAYIAIDKSDRVAVSRGIDKLIRSVLKKYFNKKTPLNIFTEIEQDKSGKYNTPLSKRIARYAKAYKHDSFYIDAPYIQPNMPCDGTDITKEDFMSLIYVPYYKAESKVIAKAELIKIIEFIYFAIYSPSCNELKCDCGSYNEYLTTLLMNSTHTAIYQVGAVAAK